MFSFSLNNFIFTIIFSLLIILAGHFLWNYLRDNYTTKKTKNIIHGQIEKYQKIIEQIQGQSINDEFLNEKDVQDLNNDLAAFANGL
uniref:Uncharacterized protein n=1 Tax=viral metagenome TaxID=1070528 RepID=A0A6C0B6S4_9ZZZZ